MKNLILFLIAFLLVPVLAGAQVIHTFELNWADNSDNEEGFFIYRGSPGPPFITFTVGENITTFQDKVTGFPGDSFCWQVSAFNHQFVDGTGNLQESSKTNQICGIIPVPSQPVPNAPTGLTVQAVSSSEIQASWSDNSDNEKNFEIAWQQFSPPRSEIFDVPANTTSHRITGLQKNKTSCLQVRAVGFDDQKSEYSNESCTTTRR